MTNKKVTRAILFLLLFIVSFWLGVIVRLRILQREAPSEPLLITQFVDVGDGDAAIIRAPGGWCALIDAGPDADAARRVIAQMHRLDIRSPQAVIVTCARPGSIGGLSYLLAHTGFRGVVVLPMAQDRFLSAGGDAAATAISTAQDENLKIRAAQTYTTRELPATGGDSRLTIHLLDVDEQPQTPLTRRKRCRRQTQPAAQDALAVRVDYGLSSLIDASGLLATGEDAATSDADLSISSHGGGEWDCDVLGAAPGSPNNMSYEFLAMTNPWVVVLSSASDSPPDQDILARLDAAGAQVDRTDENGDITLGLSANPGDGVVTFSPTSMVPAVSRG